ncbi:protein kinase, partial [Halorhodospira sp. 9622]|uniref:protein kinase domain-containing protein n=1 Tax=Halorhodospira sp. 9622 TaxID=2899136 RepID=UPI001EE9434F
MSEIYAHHMALPGGYQLENYRIEAELGNGGFGITYRAWDTRLERRVAIKEYLPREHAYRDSGSTVRPISGQDAEMFEWGLERFLDEARTLAKFDHPSIVRVLQFFRANDTAYLVMEYCDGAPLDRVLKRDGCLAPAQAQALAEALLGALEQLHRQDVIHRDIKPANIFIREDGTPVLLDFGSARQAVGGRSRSMTSVVSPHYAAFEQYSTNGNQGPWTDLYGLAATLYHGVTGERPPEASSRMEHDELVPAVEAGQGYPRSLLKAMDAALQVRAVDRVQTAQEWRQLMGESAPGGRGNKERRRWPAVAAVLVTGGAATALGAYWYYQAEADRASWAEAEEVDTRSAYEAYLSDCDGRPVCAHQETAERVLQQPRLGTKLHTFEGHGSSVRSVAIAPDGEWLLSGA